MKKWLFGLGFALFVGAPITVVKAEVPIVPIPAVTTKVSAKVLGFNASTYQRRAQLRTKSADTPLATGTRKAKRSRIAASTAAVARGEPLVAKRDRRAKKIVRAAKPDARPVKKLKAKRSFDGRRSK